MPRYFFHVHDGEDIPDEDGTELADIDTARRQAVQYAGALLAEAGGQFWGGAAWRMVVTDARGTTLFELHFTAHDASPTADAPPRHPD